MKAELQPDGSLLLSDINLLGTETGTVEFTCQVRRRGSLSVPEPVVKGGPESVRVHVLAHLDTLEETSCNYVYGSSPGEGWHITSRSTEMPPELSDQHLAKLLP